MSGPAPRSLGYRMPAEWEPQERVWLVWPTNTETWPGPLLDAVRATYARIVAVLAADQPVGLLVDYGDRRAEARALLSPSALLRVDFHSIPTVDVWIRDFGPTFVVLEATGAVAGVEWGFNAWGNKYPDLTVDGAVSSELNRRLSLERFRAGIVLEGGSIDVDGRGTLLTTEQCLLHANRNPHMTSAEIERALRDFLGVSRIVWLGGGVAGDDTDGHVDEVARFVGPGTVLAAFEDDPADENHHVLEDNYRRLERAADADGRPLTVLKLPRPDPVTGPGGRLPASYANFYIGNASVLAPVFGQAKDRWALEIIQSCFPSRRVVGVNAAALVHGFGGIHCVTQPQPAVKPYS